MLEIVTKINLKVYIFILLGCCEACVRFFTDVSARRICPIGQSNLTVYLGFETRSGEL
jgi:hypothetical protein